MGEIKSHRDLIVWQKSMDMAAQVYAQCKQMPASETYGLTAQLTRAAASVPANIAEGNARGTADAYCYAQQTKNLSLLPVTCYLTQ